MRPPRSWTRCGPRSMPELKKKTCKRHRRPCMGTFALSQWPCRRRTHIGWHRPCFRPGSRCWWRWRSPFTSTRDRSCSLQTRGHTFHVICGMKSIPISPAQLEIPQWTGTSGKAPHSVIFEPLGRHTVLTASVTNFSDSAPNCPLGAIAQTVHRLCTKNQLKKKPTQRNSTP